ncbi:hypothetical protein GOV14_02635 [Candidatus Pacearchaeota archaeon]|nr:hypothetical protein [Candidatus Pacearchaeota archaeon]
MIPDRIRRPPARNRQRHKELQINFPKQQLNFAIYNGFNNISPHQLRRPKKLLENAGFTNFQGPDSFLLFNKSNREYQSIIWTPNEEVHFGGIYTDRKKAFSNLSEAISNYLDKFSSENLIMTYPQAAEQVIELCKSNLKKGPILRPYEINILKRQK